MKTFQKVCCVAALAVLGGYSGAALEELEDPISQPCSQQDTKTVGDQLEAGSPETLTSAVITAGTKSRGITLSPCAGTTGDPAAVITVQNGNDASVTVVMNSNDKLNIQGGNTVTVTANGGEVNINHSSSTVTVTNPVGSGNGVTVNNGGSTTNLAPGQSQTFNPPTTP